MPRALGPTEFNRLRQQYGVYPGNFDKYFIRDTSTGGILVKDEFDPRRTIAPQTGSLEQLTSPTAVQQRPEYQQNLGFITQETDLARQEYARQQEAIRQSQQLQRGDIQLETQRTKQDLIRSYQDALDQINFNARQLGIENRADVAQRGLYDPSGRLSGIGENVSVQRLEPITRQTRMLAQQQTQALSRLSEDKQRAVAKLDFETQNTLGRISTELGQLGLRSAKQKADLFNEIVSNIIKGYEAQQKEARDREREARRQFEVDRRFEFDVDKERFDRELALRRLVNASSGGSGSTSRTSTAIKRDLTSDINNVAELVSPNDRDTGPNYLTRQQIAQRLLQEYGDQGYTYQQLLDLVKKAYPEWSGAGQRPW